MSTGACVATGWMKLKQNDDPCTEEINTIKFN